MNGDIPDRQITDALLVEETRTAPRKELWSKLLLEILSAERDREIESVGSPRQYVLRLLTDSKPASAAANSFNSALKQLVISWQPQQQDAYYNGCMLQLVAAFTPPFGFDKVLKALTLWKRLGPVVEVAPHFSIGLFNLGLSALEAYHTTPEDNPDNRSYKLYIEYLWSLSSIPDHIPHAFRRLVELKELELTGSKHAAVLKGFISTPGVIEEFLRYAVGVHYGILKHSIGDLINLCLEVDALAQRSIPGWLFQAFLNTFKSFGCEMSGFRNGIPNTIDLPNGDELPIALSPASKVRYREIQEFSTKQRFFENVRNYAHR